MGGGGGWAGAGDRRVAGLPEGTCGATRGEVGGGARAARRDVTATVAVSGRVSPRELIRSFYLLGRCWSARDIVNSKSRYKTREVRLVVAILKLAYPCLASFFT